jgi:hypothetical protein
LKSRAAREPIVSVALFDGRLNIDCESLALDDAEAVLFLAEGEPDDF